MQRSPPTGYADDQCALERLRDLGFSPSSVLDVGASTGPWTVACATVFPCAHYFLVEPQASFRAASLVPSEIHHRWIPHAIGATEGVVDLQLPGRDSASYGAHILQHRHGTKGRGQQRVRMTTLDRLLADGEIEPPQLLKLDVQGYEHEVLSGGSRCLKNVEVVFAETSLLPHWENGPLIAQTLEFFNQLGFAAFDFISPLRLNGSGVLSQIDLVLVRRDSRLRSWEVLDHEATAGLHLASIGFARRDRAILRRLSDGGRRPHLLLDVNPHDATWTSGFLHDFCEASAIVLLDSTSPDIVIPEPLRMSGRCRVICHRASCASDTALQDSCSLDRIILEHALPFPDAIRISEPSRVLSMLTHSPKCLGRATLIHVSLGISASSMAGTGTSQVTRALEEIGFEIFDLSNEIRDASGTLASVDTIFVRTRRDSVAPTNAQRDPMLPD